MEGLGHLFCSHSHPDGGFLRCLRDSERAGWPCGPVRANLAQYWHGLDDLLCYAVALEDALTGAGIHAPFCMILHATELPWCTQLCAKRANWKRSSGTTGCVSQTRLLNNSPSSGPNLNPCPVSPVAKTIRGSDGRRSRMKSWSGVTSYMHESTCANSAQRRAGTSSRSLLATCATICSSGAEISSGSMREPKLCEAAFNHICPPPLPGRCSGKPYRSCAINAGNVSIPNEVGDRPAK